MKYFYELDELNFTISNEDLVEIHRLINNTIEKNELAGYLLCQAFNDFGINKSLVVELVKLNQIPDKQFFFDIDGIEYSSHHILNQFMIAKDISYQHIKILLFFLGIKECLNSNDLMMYLEYGTIENHFESKNDNIQTIINFFIKFLQSDNEILNLEHGVKNILLEEMDINIKFNNCTIKLGNNDALALSNFMSDVIDENNYCKYLNVVIDTDIDNDEKEIVTYLLNDNSITEKRVVHNDEENNDCYVTYEFTNNINYLNDVDYKFLFKLCLIFDSIDSKNLLGSMLNFIILKGKDLNEILNTIKVQRLKSKFLFK
jgi:hypothetical protein